MKTITVGQKVSIFDMHGVCVGFKQIARTAKNYCDGQSTIQLSPITLPLIQWDGASCPVTCDDVGALEFTASHIN